jgi:excisionase family DNA binding protein
LDKSSSEPEAPALRARQDVVERDRSATTGVVLDEPLLTTEVAWLLAVPRSSVYEYARRLGDPLPCLRIGRHRRFYRSAVEAWVERQVRR